MLDDDRQVFEWTCSIAGGGCGKVFDVKMNISFNGKHRINCPNCKHKHFRIVDNGKITDTRYEEREAYDLADDIHPMMSSCRDFYKEKTENVSIGKLFLRELWAKTTSLTGRSKNA